MVPESEWVLAASLAPIRIRRLKDPPASARLLAALGREADEASVNGQIAVRWEQSEERPGYFRLAGQIPIGEVTFDQFFNGRTGYRARYFESIESGENFNRLVLERLTAPLLTNFTAQLQVAPDLAKHSLESRYSKVWVGNEKAVFNEAPPYQLVPNRWVKNGAYLGCRAPLPATCILDVKGTFVHPGTRQSWVDPIKLGRSRDLFDKGYT